MAMNTRENRFEFDSKRAGDYITALRRFPDARKEDILRIAEWLQLKRDDTVAEIGAGCGYISAGIADYCAKVMALDPSPEQLSNVSEHSRGKVVPIWMSATKFPLESESMDAVYTFGGFHHIRGDHHEWMSECRRIIRPGGKLLICDVGEGTNLARHFDERVVIHCSTGHSRGWINPTYFSSLCQRAGLTVLGTAEVRIRWKFNTENDMAVFIQLLHSMRCSVKEVLEGIRAHLEVERLGGNVNLVWPMLFGLAAKPF